MNQLFHSATVRLTTWYVIILASICLMFSVIVYQITMNEVSHRLDSYGLHAQEIKSPSPVKKLFSEIRSRELTATRANLVVILFYVNVIIIVSGGFGAYFLARHTLRPIEEAHDQQSRFVSDASHELRTPLATMTTELEVALRDSTLTKQEMRELLDAMSPDITKLLDRNGIFGRLHWLLDPQTIAAFSDQGGVQISRSQPPHSPPQSP